MIAIHTKFIPPTNTKGARIKAYTTTGFSRTISYPYSWDSVEGHFEAVLAMVRKHKLDWDLSNMRHGDSCDSKGYTFCFDASVVPSVNNQLKVA
jgi:hypothetical protein